MRPRERDADEGHGEKDRRQGVRESEPLAGEHEPNDVADGAEPFDDLVGATTDHGHRHWHADYISDGAGVDARFRRLDPVSPTKSGFYVITRH